MVVVDEERCVGCGRCMAFCPREALWAWGRVRVDTRKCSECFGGVYQFEQNAPLQNRESLLDTVATSWTRLCLINCPVGALRVEEE